jgi:hypothetical protein
MGNNLQSPESKILEKPFPVRWVMALLLALLAVLILAIVILSWVPPVSKDALVHHLAVPKLYVEYGGIREIPSIPFSYFPMNLDLLYVIPLYFENDIVPKFIHFSFALLTAWLIFNYLRRRINIIYALFGSFFFLSVPIIVKLSISVYVDLGLIFFSTASLLFVLKWIESGFRLRFLILSAILCGLAVGTKYNGLIVLILLTFSIPYLHSKYGGAADPSFSKSAGYGILFLIIALIFFSPWMIKNYLWTNNPVFPLYDHWFNPQHGATQKSMSLFTLRALKYNETWWQMALLPVRIFFQGQDGVPQYFDGKLNPFLLLFPFLAFFHIKRDPEIIRNEKKILIAFAGLFFGFAFFSSGLRIRYLSPIIPPLVILSVLGLKNLLDILENSSSPARQKIGRAIVLLIIFFSLLLNAKYIFTQYGDVKPFEYLGGTLTREEYIERHRPEYAAMRYINDHLPSDARILFIFLGNRGYYCDREYVFDMKGNRSSLRQLVMGLRSPEKVLIGLKNMGVTHLIIHHNIFEKWVESNFSNEQQKILQNFFKNYVKLLYFKINYGVYQLEGL